MTQPSPLLTSTLHDHLPIVQLDFFGALSSSFWHNSTHDLFHRRPRVGATSITSTMAGLYSKSRNPSSEWCTPWQPRSPDALLMAGRRASARVPADQSRLLYDADTFQTTPITIRSLIFHCTMATSTARSPLPLDARPHRPLGRLVKCLYGQDHLFTGYEAYAASTGS